MGGFWSRLFSPWPDQNSRAPTPAVPAPPRAELPRSSPLAAEHAINDHESVEHPTFELAGYRDCQTAIGRCTLETQISIEHDQTRAEALVVTADGIGQVGRITARHPVAKALATGQVVLHASINSFSSPDGNIPGTLRLRVVTGPEGAAWSMPPPAPPRSYPVGLVGEQHYQMAVCRCVAGQPVTLYRETGNPHDACAVVVLSAHDETIGYLARDSWLRETLLDGGKGCEARIKSTRYNSSRDFEEVIIEVAFVGGGLAKRPYQTVACP